MNSLAIGRLDKAIFIDAAVSRQTANQTDVRAFWRLDRADPAIVRMVNVTYIEASALTAQATRAQRGESAFMPQLGQRIRLIHKLRQLR